MTTTQIAGDGPNHEAAALLFDLDHQAPQGINDSERILAGLCQRSFLRLWVQSNVYSDEGLRDGKGNGVELCDALAVFGDDVIIFSDKQAAYHEGVATDVAWSRWYKRAIDASVRQLHGGLHWLQRFPSRAFLDARCTRALPVPLPENPRFHLVAVTRGSRAAAQAFAGGQGRGSLAIDSAVVGKEHLSRPFVIGRPDPRKRFVHVFDEVSIELVLGEMDTAMDFIEYLRKREALLGRADAQVLAKGEEDLLATYLVTMSEDDSEHVFVQSALPDLIEVEEGLFDSLETSAPYLRKKAADRESYIWDELIDKFLRHAAQGVAPGMPAQTREDAERGVRFLAAESRFRRRQLGASLVALVNRIRPGESITRLVDAQVAGESVFVLSIQSKRADETLQKYREFRQAKLAAQVHTAKLLSPLGTTFVGIGMDSPYKDYVGFSEDLFVLSQIHWSEQELQRLEQLRTDLDLWADHRVERSRYQQYEFPLACQRQPFVRMDEQGFGNAPLKQSVKEALKPNGTRASTEKRKRKMRRASQKQNRRKGR